MVNSTAVGQENFTKFDFLQICFIFFNHFTYHVQQVCSFLMPRTTQANYVTLKQLLASILNYAYSIIL